MAANLRKFALNDRKDLVAAPVLEALERMHAPIEQIEVAEIDPAFSDTEEFCRHYGYETRNTANTVIVEATRSGVSRLAVVVMMAADRADINGAVRKALEARRVSLAPKEDAVGRSGMEYGSITVIGLPDGWPKLIDARLQNVPNLLMGGGLRRSKLLLPGRILGDIPGAQLMNNLGRE